MPVMLDQGGTSQCVAYAWLHFFHDLPYPHKSPVPLIKPQKLYNLARKRDEWPGEDYEGSSVRGGIQAALELIQEKFEIEYRWVLPDSPNILEQVVTTVLEVGPMVLGTNWYEDMLEPDNHNFVHASGEIVGGHAYVISGVNVKKKKFRIQNSWGREWGDNGCAWIDFYNLEALIAEDGEACIAVEKQHET
jgi:hypothetical protein